MSATDISALNLIAGDALAKELRLRQSRWRYQRVPAKRVESEIEDGWEVDKVLKASVRMRFAKPLDEVVEDEAWALLASLGFPQMSAGRRFTVPVTAGGKPATKQIDVLAADDETCLVVECKWSAAVAARSMAKDLGESRGLKGPVAAALRQDYGLKRKVGWVYFTRGIRWGAKDLARAKEFGIAVLDENDLDYFARLVDLIGPAARHQLQAEVFGSQEIEGLQRTVPAVRGRIGGRTFYQFTIDPERLLKIGYVAHRLHLDADSLGAYQRMLKKNRLRDIRQYIEKGGVFPTNVVVNFRTKRRFALSADRPPGDVNFGTLYLPKTYKSAWIIDGQHRLYGFAGSKWAKSNQLPVLAFEALPPSEEVRMFVDINNRQVKVPRNLIVDLMSELYWDSGVPSEAYHAILSRIVAVLNKDIGSPIRRRIVLEGERQTPQTPLTVTAVYEALSKSGLVGTIRKNVLIPGPLHATDSAATVKRSVAVFEGYLKLFADGVPDHWALGNGEGGYLCTNNGVTALLLVLEAVIGHLHQHADAEPWQQSPEELLAAIAPFVAPVVELFQKASPMDIRQFRRQVGNAGQRLSAFAMMEAIREAKPGFNPSGLDEYVKGQDQTGTTLARQLVPELQLKIQDATLRLLRAKYGSSEEGWWRKGVPLKVRTEVAGRREANPQLGALEQFFELLDYRAIAADNFDDFAPFFAMGPNQGKDSSLHWFSRLNDIRNRIAHPERGSVSDDEIAFIESLLAHFEEREGALPIGG